jgi:hypothetical protein
MAEEIKMLTMIVSVDNILSYFMTCTTLLKKTSGDFVFTQEEMMRNFVTNTVW